MTSVSVLVPARLDDERAELWAWLKPQWTALGFEVIEGTVPDGAPWSKGAAVADALTRATGDILVVTDADVWCDPRAVEQAIAHVSRPVNPSPWAMPHERVLRLTKAATARVLAGQGWPEAPGEVLVLDDRLAKVFAERPYVGVLGGGIVVLHRKIYEQIPIDPRFLYWGQEDEAWARALLTLAGYPSRGKADLWHLYHAPSPMRQSRGLGSPENVALFHRYQAAAQLASRGRRDVAAMRALIAEIRGR